MIDTAVGFVGSGLLGSIVGGLFRLAPEIIKWLDRRDERKHELNMFQHQTDLEKVRGNFRVEERYVDYSIAQTNAIEAAFKSQAEEATKSYRWVSALSALVRPLVTYIIFGLYVVFKLIMISYAINSGAAWTEVIVRNWTLEDFAMLNMILTFWFVGRTIEKRNPTL